MKLLKPPNKHPNTSQRRSAWKAAAGGYEHIPSEKSLISDSLGHKSESTECGPDLLYCLIKINLLCPVVRMKDGTSNRRLFGISSFLTIERRQQLWRQLDSWRVASRGGWGGAGHRKHTTATINRWLGDSRGRGLIRTNSNACLTPLSRLNTLNLSPNSSSDSKYAPKALTCSCSAHF